MAIKNRSFALAECCVACDIPGRLLLMDTPENIKWVHETHMKGFPAFKNSKVTAYMLVGNEDCPDEIWATIESLPINWRALFFLVAKSSEGKFEYEMIHR
jgi:hypothetical protein